MNKQLRAGLLLTLTALIWGAAFVAQSVGIDYVGPFTYLCSRNIIGGIVLLPLIKFTSKSEAPGQFNKRDLIIGGICCGIALFVASILQQVGIKYTSVGKAGFITSLYMIIVPIISIFFGKKASKKIWFSVVIAVVGMYCLCINGESSINKGDMLVLCCAFGFAVHILIIDHFSPKVNGIKMSCIQFWICAAISAVPMLITEKPTMNSIIAA